MYFPNQDVFSDQSFNLTRTSSNNSMMYFCDYDDDILRGHLRIDQQPLQSFMPYHFVPYYNTPYPINPAFQYQNYTVPQNYYIPYNYQQQQYTPMPYIQQQQELPVSSLPRYPSIQQVKCVDKLQVVQFEQYMKTKFEEQIDNILQIVFRQSESWILNEIQLLMS
eukprot:TRINITY_DN5259_c0_g1_i4.p2 TRINITY_DN5259_c0_g1~~TRINITY_DN5259_c0_g1_i4.p2  ORF type:complete len:165 (-),score=0.32 TRINITY_DN5259_c0_g1_i4:48-542(-)